jgi:hypothetical protein
MGRPERPLDAAAGPISEFARDLRRLRHLAGSPSYRELARTALFAPSVLSSAAAGYRLPTLPVTLAFATACGGDRDTWERRWRMVASKAGAATEFRDLRPPAPIAAVTEQPQSFRRLAPAPARPAQLPMGSCTFVGRRQSLGNARHFICQSTPLKFPLVVSGPIGVGKTAFALRLADDISADFPDGQLYADLSTSGRGGQRPDEIIGGFLRALAVPASHVPDDPTERVGLYRSLLAQRRLFVLLENARDEYQVRPLLGRTSHSQLVVTGRARLLGLEGAHRIDLPAFCRTESMALIGLLAGAQRVRAEFEAADALAELCGDLPLAVNIVGRKIAARPEWPIAYTARLLASRDRLMDSLSVGDVNVRDRFASAYKQLPPAGQQMLHRLARRGTGWATAIGLAAAMGTDIGSSDELLESLVDAGLLTRAGVAGRYYISTLVSMFVEQCEAAAAAVPPQTRPAAAGGDRDTAA